MYIKHFFITASIFFAVDIFWLVFVAKGLYKNYLGHLMADQVFYWSSWFILLSLYCGVDLFCY